MSEREQNWIKDLDYLRTHYKDNAGSPAAADKQLHFTDADQISGWALDALRWATEKGVVNGKGGGILDPGGQATRAETAQMLKNFMENQ